MSTFLQKKRIASGLCMSCGSRPMIFGLKCKGCSNNGNKQHFTYGTNVKNLSLAELNAKKWANHKKKEIT